MTIPMLPGFWDENKEAIQSLAQTITRSINPHFDNQLALTQSIRQNPENLQGIIDMSALNPEMFAQTFGPRMLQQLASMGNPSSQATIEKGARKALTDETPIADVAPTVMSDAVATATGSRTATDLAKGEAEIERIETSTQETIGEMTQRNFVRQLENPVLKFQWDQINKDIEMNPEIAQVRPQELAKQYLAGQLNNDEFAGQLQALEKINRPAYDAFWKSVEILNQAARDEEVDKRIQKRMDLDFGRTNDIALREARRAAWKTFRELGVGYEDMVKHYMGETVPIVELRMKDNAEVQARADRIRLMRELDAQTRTFIQAKGDGKGIAKTGLEVMMNQIVQGIVIEDVKDGWFSKRSAYTYNGEKVNGDQLAEIFNDPTEWKKKQELEKSLQGMNLGQLRSMAEITARRIREKDGNQQDLTNLQGQLNDLIKSKVGEATKAARSDEQRR